MIRSILEGRIDGDLLRRRALAFVVDAAVAVGAAAVGTAGRARSRGRRVALVGLVSGVGGLFYHVLLEGWRGQTVGKRLLGVRVIAADGGRCTYGAAAIRTAFRFIDALPVGYLVGIVSIALTDRGRRLGDLAAGTVVVRVGEGDGVDRAADEGDAGRTGGDGVEAGEGGDTATRRRDGRN